MSIKVIKSGLLDTIQDTGRVSYAKWGINPGGVMDRFAAQVANAIVGNDIHAAVLEIHFPSLQLQFQKDILISLTGADFTPFIDRMNVPLWKPVIVKKGSILSFQRKQKRARCYMAVHGGLNVPLWLGSASTNLKLSVGGVNGVSIKKGDEILVNETQQYQFSSIRDIETLPWSVNIGDVYSNSHEICFIEGNEWPWLTAEAQQQMLFDAFTINPSSDRMGYYLDHKSLQFNAREELISSAVSFGTIQALPSGKLVILMADHQTTGGYPRIGHVVSADLPKLSQLHAHEQIRFKKVSVNTAEKMLLSLLQDVRLIQQSCKAKLDSYVQH